MNKKVLRIAIALIILGIILDAFSAHALKTHISFEQFTSFKTATKYHLFHSLALFIIGINYEALKVRRLTILLFLSGIICFSCSIYLLALKDLIQFDVTFLGPITPFGGLLLILSWCSLLWTK